jgi:Cd2+/Zn2+-exporting ATPase
VHAADKHSCHDHKHDDNSIQEHVISIESASPAHQEEQSQCGRHSDKHKEEGCGHHPKAKDHIPALTDCSRGSCHGTVSSKACESKGKDICPSWQVGRTGMVRRCCRTRVRSCCSHSMLKLPEIIIE